MALFDQSAETYDEWCKTPLGSFVDALEKQLMKSVAEPKQGEKALDLGCGTGIYSIWLSHQGVNVTGIDISSAMLEIAKKKAEKYPGIRFVQGDIHFLPFADQSFDLVIANIVLEFVESPKQVVAEALRVLKPGGRLVIGMIGKHSYWARKYEQQGKQNKQSVFSRAQFFSLADIEQLAMEKPTIIKPGLYVAPEEFINEEQAMDLEQQRSQEQPMEKAGYLVARWEKKI